eukprot:TRINITY_DN8230_c7_g1_i1.p1 TRINITY_DN8230_c7_g1~~TRINITY_DN8230_c7_g1_i1.p1  ORF type:complete len:561 (-),score=143.52 TRINITY_DN8230_c7_g1_i1:204-1886(-)
MAPARSLTVDENAAAVPPQRGMPPPQPGSVADASYLKGVPNMEVFVKFEKSWSIQDALDQHAALAEQREVLSEIGRNRLRVRQTQLSFAELEVEESLDAARSISALDAGDAQRVMQLAGRVRAAVRDLRIAVRMKQMEQGVVSRHMAQADAEIEKSRQEMTSLKEVIDDKSLMLATDDAQPQPSPPVDADNNPLQQKYKYCTNCKVGGHGQRFCEYFLERPDWRTYPNQKWFEDDKGNEYHCPLGKKLVDFADESHFSRIAMYLKGRAWLEEKTKVLELAPGLIPETFIIANGQWKGPLPPADEEVSNLPWFCKEADRNWGTSVHCVAKPSHCLQMAKPDAVYVVQQHIKDPLLMDDGRKCHIKFYVLLVGYEDGQRWKLYTFKDGYLSISPNKWTPEDLSKDTQVTIIRSERITHWKPWPDVYPKCKDAVGKVIDRAISQGKLEGRLGKTQFEIFSADFIVNTDGDVWLFEFNMSPVLKDPKDAPKVNDADMVRGALYIVSPYEGGSPGLWDFAGEFVGAPPPPKAPPAGSTTDGSAAADAPADAAANKPAVAPASAPA